MTQTVFLTPYCYLSFPNLDKPKASQDGGDPKFNASLVIPKAELAAPLGVVQTSQDPSKNTVPWLNLLAFAKAKFAEEFQKDGRVLADNMFFKDQDQPNRNGTVPSLKYDNLKGTVALSVSNKLAVACINAQNHIIPVQNIRNELYPGCRVRAVISFYTFRTEKNSGLAINLHSIQKVGDSTPWGGVQVNGMEYFTPVADGSDDPSLYAQQQPVQQYVQPVQQYAQQPVQQYVQPVQQYAPQPAPAPQAAAVFGVTPQTFHQG